MDLLLLTIIGSSIDISPLLLLQFWELQFNLIINIFSHNT